MRAALALAPPRATQKSVQKTQGRPRKYTNNDTTRNSVTASLGVAAFPAHGEEYEIHKEHDGPGSFEYNAASGEIELREFEPLICEFE